MRRLIAISLVGFLPFTSRAYKEVLDIGILWGNRPASVLVSVETGSYTLMGDNAEIRKLSEGQTCVFAISGAQVEVTSGGKTLGKFYKVNFQRNSWGGEFNLKSLEPKIEKRIYPDHLLVSSLHGKLKLINNVYLEHYIAGVVEAESGTKQGYEYYKVQAIIARTYALSNLNKYAEYGFNLCDRVQSQVFKGVSRGNPEILRAVNATRGLVIVDSDINLIQAVFHSNSGGQTANSEDAWSKPVRYLRSVPDTFSKDMPHYIWSTFIEKTKWLNYLNKKYKYPVEDSTSLLSVLSFNPSERQGTLCVGAPNIPLKEIRKDWSLKSTFFSIRTEGEYVYFEGKGFGHGVGLSQEGAMRMADAGISYNKILHHYYKDVHLIHLSALSFFKGD
jgi:stage II sporulation protein D